MRELDQLLGWFLDARYTQADAQTQGAFRELLEQPDPDLWHWLQGHGSPERMDWRGVIDEIRARDRV